MSVRDSNQVDPPKPEKLKTLLLFVGINTACVWCIWYGMSTGQLDAQILGWIGFSFFGVGGVIALAIHLARGSNLATVVLGDDGIEVTRCGTAVVIRYEDIEEILFFGVKHSQYIGLQTKESRERRGIAAWYHRKTMGNCPAVLISNQDVAMPLSDLTRLINERRALET